MKFNLGMITQYVPMRTIIILVVGLVIGIIGYIIWNFKLKEGGIIGNDYIEPEMLILGFVVITFAFVMFYMYSKGLMMVYLPYALGMIVMGSLIYYGVYKYKKYTGDVR